MGSHRRRSGWRRQWSDSGCEADKHVTVYLVEFGPLIATHAAAGTLALSVYSEEVGYESA